MQAFLDEPVERPCADTKKGAAAPFFCRRSNSPARCLLRERCGHDCFRQAFCHRMMGLHAVLVLDDLSVQFIDQHVDRSIQVMRDTFGMQILTLDMKVDFCFLAFFFFCQAIDTEDHVDVDDMIEMASDACQFALHVFADCGGESEVMATNGQIHTASYTYNEIDGGFYASSGCLWSIALEPCSGYFTTKKLTGVCGNWLGDFEYFAVFGDSPACYHHPLFCHHIY